MPKTVWRGNFIEALSDGRWEYVRRARDLSAAVIVAVTEANELVLVEQYRVPLGRRCLELPAGMIDDGEGAAQAAARELEEETGFRAATMIEIGSFASSPGLTSESFTLFRADGLTRGGGGGGTDGEDIAVEIVPVGELPRFIAAKRDAGVMIDVKLIAGLRLL